jgi:hypothetical protein
MELERLLDLYQRYCSLMERSAQAIDRQDLRTLEDIAQESAALLAEIRIVWYRVEVNPSLLQRGAMVERLRRLMQDGLTWSERNQERVSRWLEQTGESLQTAMQGSAAMAGYGALGRQAQGLLNAKI